MFAKYRAPNGAQTWCGYGNYKHVAATQQKASRNSVQHFFKRGFVDDGDAQRLRFVEF